MVGLYRYSEEEEKVKLFHKEEVKIEGVSRFKPGKDRSSSPGY